MLGFQMCLFSIQKQCQLIARTCSKHKMSFSALWFRPCSMGKNPATVLGVLHCTSIRALVDVVGVANNRCRYGTYTQRCEHLCIELWSCLIFGMENLGNVFQAMRDLKPIHQRCRRTMAETATATAAASNNNKTTRNGTPNNNVKHYDTHNAIIFSFHGCDFFHSGIFYLCWPGISSLSHRTYTICDCYRCGIALAFGLATTVTVIAMWDGERERGSGWMRWKECTNE